MIREIDDALRELLRSRALTGSEVEVVLDAPTTDWAARRNAPTVNMFLYDIREDPRWRERGLAPRTEDGAVTGRIPAPHLFKLSYLVTAWTARPEDEHRLLDTILSTLLGCAVLPGELLGGHLTDTRIPMSVGMPPPEDRGFADVWSSLGGQLKPSLDVVLSAPMTAGAVRSAGPPVLQPPILVVADRRDGGTDRAQHHRPPAPSPTAAARGVADTSSATDAAPTDAAPTEPSRPARRTRKPRA